MKTLLSVVVALAVPSTAHAAKVYGVAVEGTTQSLVTWDSGAPNVILSSMVIGGLPANETIRGIDFDPFYAPGFQRLFAIGAGADQYVNVYQIELVGGLASKLPAVGAPTATSAGQSYYGVAVRDSYTILSVDDLAIKSQ